MASQDTNETTAVLPGRQSAPASDHSGHRPLRAWWAVAVLMILQALSFVDRQILSLLIVEIRQDLAMNDFQVSLLHGVAFAAFYCIAGVFIGYIVDRYPARRVLYFSVTVWSFATAAVGFAKTYWGMMAARMLTGAGEGGVNPAAQTLIASMFPNNRISLPMSLFSMAGAIGIGLSYFGGGLLLEALTAHSLPGLESLPAWRQVLIVVGAPGLLIAFLSFTIFESRPLEKKKVSVAHGWREFGRFLASERHLCSKLVVGYALNVVVSYAAATWAPTYGRRVLGMSPAEVGMQMGAIAMIGGVLAGGIYGYIVDTQFSRGRIDFMMRAYFFGALVAIPICVLGFTLDQHPLFIAALIVVQCIWSAAIGPLVAAIQIVTPAEMRGRMAGFIVAVANLSGYGLGAMVVGALTDFVFGDPQKLGLSIALTVLIFGPISVWLVWSARSYFTACVIAGENGAQRTNRG